MEAHLDSPLSLSDIVREETDNGRLIIRFLIDLMQGSLESAKPCHRLDAARQLLNIGFTPAHAFIAANTTASQPARRSPSEPSTHSTDPDSLHKDLAALICEETDNGRSAVRFLVDVMQGNLQAFKPHHRLSAARELLHRGFDAPTLARGSAAAGSDDDPRRLDPDGIYYRDRNGNWQRDNARSPAPSPDHLGPRKEESAQQPTFPSKVGNRYQQEPGPFNFETYDEADYRRDCYGEYALRHVLGSEQAVKAATLAVLDYRRRIGWFDKQPGQSIEPFVESWAVPDDAPLTEDIYGYPVLLRIYGSECAARVAAHAAYLYHRELRAINFATSGRSGSAPLSPDRLIRQDPCPGSPEALPPERPPPSESEPRPAGMSLDNRATDSVTYYQYQYGDGLCRSP
ncbi:MAG: hypothetical protein OXR67_08775 [Chloroflexota bacterium]|nr:hypothetical protein [Chloroflexota bacterium]